MMTVNEIVSSLVEKLGANINKFETLEEDGITTISLDTDSNARLIGKDGEHLRAILLLAREIAAKQGIESTFRVDIGGFEKSLREKYKVDARMYAERAKHIGKLVDVPRVDSFARRVMHAYVAANYPDLVTQSEGEGKDRHLTIAPK